MRSLLVSLLLLGGTTAIGCSKGFEKPVRLQVGDEFVRVEEPGFAAPCWADIDDDGKPELLVGQFNKGKIQAFRHLDGNQFVAGQFLQAGGKDAEIPGVW